ncbi:MAG: Asp-tRNA(Asn)/Glu-tRNA(Gln) amidotransferase subunit GatC [Nitrososphaerota archaeon]|jgi:aspartyl/glutamyl-tRNA(Asn/Gln) amidotransferase C subunit|nr:Asp-tRNA(Asn)/Glu-tRNA(Gln) amidotransferase subunit GatC [Nitrososphaeraceae archaeon]
MISKEDLEHLAQISRINLTEYELEKFPKQLDKTIEYIDILEELASDDSVNLDLQELRFEELRMDEISMSDNKQLNKNITEDGFLRGPKMK